MKSNSLTVTEISGQEQLEAIKGEWDALLARSATTNPFLVWDWLALWHQHLGRGPLTVLVARRGGQAVGIVPFERVSYGLGRILQVPTFQLIGRGRCQTEIRSLLCLPGHEANVVQAALAYLQDHNRSWHWAILDGFPADGDAYRAVTSLVEDYAEGLRQEAVETYVLELPDSWDAFRSRLKRNIKESLRHCYNSLAREGHTYAFEVWDEPDRLPEAIDCFLRLHRTRAAYQETKSEHRLYLHDQAEVGFLHAVAPRLLLRGVLHPCFLRVDGEIVAARLTLELNGQLYLYYSGFDPRWWRYSVSTTLMAECIKWAIERGLKTVNLSSGKDVSKTRWGGREVVYQPIVALRDGWLPRTAFATYAAIRHRNPSFWRRLLWMKSGRRRVLNEGGIGKR